MDAAHWELAKQLFYTALELPPAERAAFVATATDDAEVLAEVHGLLVAAAADERAEAAPRLEVGEAAGRGDAGARRDGGRGGPDAAAEPPHCERYELLRELGRGGFGTVYLARQLEPVQRTVAVKVLRGGADAARLVARFAREREAVARMSHPHIAQIHDAGTTADGRPFIAMEHVDGEALLDYGDRRRLSLAARLQLLVSVCQGVHHAHQKGVIHRDLKPSNVLVVEIDGRPVPKIIDFGIAAATHGAAAATAARGAVEPRCLGTPGYLSPEQAALDDARIDVRSDVYALGVLLFESSTGTVPHALRAGDAASLWAHLRTVQRQPAPAPSTVVDLADAAWAERRGSTPRALQRQLRGDLDWIALRALDRDPARRYQSADELAAELQRWLRHEPVRAGPATAWYRFRKLLRRHRLAAAGSVLLLVSLVGGLLATLSQYGIATAALRVAIGHRLCAEALQVVDENPAQALWMAIEGAQRAPGEDADVALYAALGHHREDFRVLLHDDVPRWSQRSADDRVLLSGDDSGLVVAVDLATGACRSRFDLHREPLCGLALAPSGAAGLSFDVAGTCHRLDTTAGAAIASVRLPAAVAAAVCVGDDDAFLLDVAGGLHRWRGAELTVVASVAAPGRALAVSANGARLAVLAGADDVVVLVADADGWRAQPAVPIAAPREPSPSDHRPQLWFDARGERLVALGAGGRIELLDLARPERSRTLVAAHGRSLAVAAEAALAACGVADGGIEMFALDRVEQWSLPWSLPGRHPAALSIDPHARAVVAIPRYRGDALVFDPVLRKALGVLRGGTHALYSPQVASDGAWFAATGHGGHVHRWRVAAFDERRELARLRLRDWTPLDGGLAVARRVEADGLAAAVVDSATGRTRTELGRVVADAPPPRPMPGASVLVVERDARTEVVAAADGRVLASVPQRLQRARCNAALSHLVGFAGDRIVLCELATGRERFAQAVPGAQYCDVDAAGARIVVAGGGSGVATVWSVAEARIERTITHRAFVFDACFEPDGRHVLTLGNDTVLQRTPLAEGAPAVTMRTPTGDFGWLRVDPSGRYIAVVVPEETLVFELASGRRRWLWRPAMASERCRDVAFAAAGDVLWVQSQDDRLRRLPLAPLAAAQAMPLWPPAAAVQQRYGVPVRTAPPPASAVRGDLEFALQQIGVGTAAALALAEVHLERVAAARQHPPTRYDRARLLSAGQRATLAGAPPTGSELTSALHWLERCLRRGEFTVEQVVAHPQLAMLQRAPAVAARLAGR